MASTDEIMHVEANKPYQFGSGQFLWKHSLPPLPDFAFDIVTHPDMERWKQDNIRKVLEEKEIADKLIPSAIPTRSQVFDQP